MEEGTPSRTAENTAVMRALHQQLPPESRIFNDPIAPRLVNPDSDAYRSRVSLLASFSESVRSRFTHYILRSRYTEDCLADGVQQHGLSQYVILGAGLDTFPYRQPAWARVLWIFEVDHPATQAWKRQRLMDAGVQIPENVRFVPVDFDSVTLGQGLSRVGFSGARPTFFSMLGVSQYLTSNALDQTLGFVLAMPALSEIVFTIVPSDETFRPEDSAWVSALTKRLAEIGEPWLTRPMPSQLAEKLKGLGFSMVTHLTPAEANALYFQGRSDGLQASETELMMRAIV